LGQITTVWSRHQAADRGKVSIFLAAPFLLPELSEYPRRASNWTTYRRVVSLWAPIGAGGRSFWRRFVHIHAQNWLIGLLHIWWCFAGSWQKKPPLEMDAAGFCGLTIFGRFFEVNFVIL
jgi:hypothetical protein